MNPVFVFLVLLAGCFLWLLCSFLYKPIGSLFTRLVKDAKEAMFENNKNNNTKDN